MYKILCFLAEFVHWRGWIGVDYREKGVRKREDAVKRVICNGENVWFCEF